MKWAMQEEREWRTRSEVKGRQKMRGGRQGEGKKNMTAIEIQKHCNCVLVTMSSPDASPIKPVGSLCNFRWSGLGCLFGVLQPEA